MTRTATVSGRSHLELQQRGHVVVLLLEGAQASVLVG
jgi:hypothetical protein